VIEKNPQSGYNRPNSGEVSEWLIEQPWKGCVGLVLTEGSNPSLSVIIDKTFEVAGFIKFAGIIAQDSVCHGFY
jgi:hypothetical protein